MPDTLDKITNDIKKCQRCELRMGATQPVPGCGEVGAKYFLIGEASGREEDEAGVPFIGAAGRKLDKLLDLAKIDINDCYFSNVIRCRPPQNRDPRKGEIKSCVEYLWREIELVKSDYIVTLGATPLGLFTQSGGVSQLHGTMFDHEKGKILCQYHPAASLHNPRLLADMLDDWTNLPEVVPHDFTITTWAENVVPDCPSPYGNLIALDTEQDGSGGLGQWSVAYRDSEGKLLVRPFFGAQPRFNFDNTPVVFHNAKYDLRVLRANKMREPKEIHDSMIQAYCLGLGKQAPKDSSKERSGSDMVGGLGLKYLARRHLGMQMKKWDEVKDDPDEVPEYNAKDSVATFLLAEKWLPILPKHYFEIDMPLLPVLMAMEDRGIQIDPAILVDLDKELDNRLANIDLPLNPHATQDIQSYVYGTLEIEPWKFTDGGQPSVEKEVLETIPDPLIKQIIEYKELHKEKGTYVDNYINAADENNRIHPEFKQTSTSTSRLSCARPNLQNVFKRDERVKLRALFVAPRGKKIVRADYDQLDFRTLAAITQDPTIIKALNAGKKIHQVTAEELNIKYDDAKTTNFGTMFGQEAWGLSFELGITIGEAKAFLKNYFERFPNLKKYRDQMTEIAKSEKKVTIPFTNRTRRIDAMFVDQWRIRQEGIKEAINMPVQGLEAEVVKIGMIDLFYKHSICPVLQVHDELLFEIDDLEVDAFAHWLRDYIPTIVEFGDMKFPVSVGIGQNWYEAMNNEVKGWDAWGNEVESDIEL